MNTYDHEDAFRDANLHAGRVIDLPAGLKTARSMDQARAMIGTMQDQYEKLFEAFIAGVAWAREEAKQRTK